MKKILFAASILLVAASCSNQPYTNNGSNQTANLKTFTAAQEWSNKFTFTYTYPSNWYVTSLCNDNGCESTIADYTKQLMPDPNLPNGSVEKPVPKEHCKFTIDSGSPESPFLENTYAAGSAHDQCSAALNTIKASYLKN